MKLRIILREVNDPFVNIPSYSGKQSCCFGLTISKQETIIEYNQIDNSALSLKKLIAKYINQQSDSIELLYKNNDNSKDNVNTDSFIELNDADSICKIQMQSQNNNTLNTSTIHKTIDDEIMLYYKVIAYPIVVKVDIYQKNIDNITKIVSLSCSILNLKHALMEKFKEDDCMEINNQKIFSVSLKNKTKKLKIKMMANKEYNDRIKLIDIIKEYEEQKGMLFSFNDNMILKFLLVLNTREAIKMGLNFNFNYFKNLSQISFENSAPVYRECSDGLNLFSYCRNTQCGLYNELFIRNFGYGTFNIITEILRTRCPKCMCASLIEARNLGLINAKWEYKGVLNKKKTSGFEGDGVTIISNKLYMFSEVKITNMFDKLIMKIKPYQANEEPIEIENDMHNNKENESSLFDSIPLCFNENNNNGKLQESDMSKVDMMITHSLRQRKSNMKTEVNLMKIKDKEGKYPSVSSSQGERDDYCFNKCLINKNANSSCCIF